MQKLTSGANWGMLAGFWVELPLLASFLLRPKTVDWQKLNEWSVKLVLPASLAGLAYGWTKPARDERKLQDRMDRLETEMQRQEASNTSVKSWVAAEQLKTEQPQEMIRQ